MATEANKQRFVGIDSIVSSTTLSASYHHPIAADMDNYARPIKITVVGNGTVGKTCILVTYTTKQFPCDYIPTVFENYATNIIVDGIRYGITIWDTAGQEEYSRLRAIAYPSTDAFILCYAICDRTSFKAVQSKWVPELRHHCPNAPILLVGTKSDLRKRQGFTFISREEGETMARTIQASTFLECSALSNENLELIFEEAVKAVTANLKCRNQCAIL